MVTYTIPLSDLILWWQINSHASTDISSTPSPPNCFYFLFVTLLIFTFVMGTTKNSNLFFSHIVKIWKYKYTYSYFLSRAIVSVIFTPTIYWKSLQPSTNVFFVVTKVGGPRVVVSTAASHARVRGSVPGLGGLKETKNVSSPSTCESQYCGEPPWPRSSVFSLRPPGLEFRILCLEDSVISIISPSSGGSLAQFSLYVHIARFISFICSHEREVMQA